MIAIPLPRAKAKSTMLKKHQLLKLFLLALTGLFSTTPAQAIYFNHFPDCYETKVLKSITKRFNKAERMTWNRGIDMLDISNPHGHNRHGFEDSSISRRYCHAYANLSNGSRHKVYYLIEANMGLAGYGWNVEFCIPRYDPWRIYDAYCRTVRPR